MTKKILQTYDSVFLNSKSILVEYHDVLKCPFFILFTSLVKNGEFNNIFDMSELSSMSEDELFYYYITRKDENILKTLNIKKEALEKLFQSNINLLYNWIELFMYEEIDTFKEFTNVQLEFNFVKVLKNLIATKIVKDIYIFTEIKSDNIQNDIIDIFGDSVHYVYGSLKDIIEKNNISNDSTFVFSNMNHMLELEEINKLNYSTVLIADKFGYNYKEDNETPIVDLDKLLEKNIFKFSFFNNILNQ